MTFTELKDKVKSYCNLTSTEADTRVGNSLNAVYRRVTTSLGLDAARFVTRNASTSIGIRTVTFSSIEKIDRLIDATDSNNIRLLTEVEIHQIRSTQPSDGAPNTWAPQNMTADGVTVVLDTVPQAVYSLQADGWASVSDLSGTDEPAFPESYHDILAWSVISEELLKKEKDKLAATYQGKAEALLSDLRFYLADSPTRETVQGSNPSLAGITGGSGGTGNQGGSSYTQTGLVTFDRDPDVPFAVSSGSDFVDNLIADDVHLENTDRLIGRDTAGAGTSEEITVGGGLEFTGSAGIQRSALTGDITAAAGSNTTALRASAALSVIGRSANSSGVPADIATSADGDVLRRSGTTLGFGSIATAGITNDAVTYAKIQNVSAASRLLGRGSASGAGDVEELTAGPGLEILSTVLNVILPSICDGRLTLTSATPVTKTDVTAATTIYFTPYTGNRVALFDGTNWALYALTERSLALGTLTASLPYDVFLFNNAGTLTLELLAWSSGTARATALVAQDGVLVKTGATTRRYLGTIRTTSTTTTEDSYLNRLVWNYYNRVRRPARVLESTGTWTYTTASFQQANAAAGNQIAVVVGVAEVLFEGLVQGNARNSSINVTMTVAIGENSTTAQATGCLLQPGTSQVANEYIGASASLRTMPAIGYTTYTWLEKSDATGTTTWAGTAGVATQIQSGLTGSIEG